MDESTTPSSFFNAAKYQFNNNKFSDVSFSVGKEKSKIYGHKMLLTFASPVFEKMFYGDLKMNCDQPIEIPDLTPTGFSNMLKSIYGFFKFDEIPLSELYETCVACNKYLVYGLTEQLNQYSKTNLNLSNCCIIYDLMVKFGDEESLNYARNFIQQNTTYVFESDYFTAIRKETLIDLLKLESVNVDEVRVMEACSKWVESELIRLGLDLNRENKNKLFEAFTPYIKFTELSIDELKKFKKLNDLLTNDEIASLFTHILDKNELFSIQCKTSRANTNEGEIFTMQKNRSYKPPSRSCLSNNLHVNRPVRIQTIWTFFKLNNTKDVKLVIYKDDIGLKLNYEVKSNDGKLYFQLNDECVFNGGYQIDIGFDEGSLDRSELSKLNESILGIDYKDQKIVFQISKYNNYNSIFIEKIGFIPKD